MKKNAFMSVILFTLVFVFFCLFFGREGVILPYRMSDIESNIFWLLRLPRVFMAFLIGASLGMTGLVFQNLFRNSLASPFTLGISSGAAFGASLSLFLGLSFTSIFAFLGALATIFFVYLVGVVKGSFRPTTLILSGVIASFLFSSGILFLFFFSSNLDTKAIVQWTMGSLSIVGFKEFYLVLPAFMMISVSLFFLRERLNIISVGDEFAITRGVDPEKLRIGLFFLLSLLLSLCVSITGPVAFVGLIIPHLARRLFGSDFGHHFLPTLFISGGFLVGCDFVAHNLLNQVVLPVGIVTSLLGAPFFLFILIKSQRDF